MSGNVETGTIETRIPGWTGCRGRAGVDAEQKSLEEVARPLTAEEAKAET